MTSVYAASSIHSKSTLSRKYEVDTSAMWNGGEKYGVKDEDYSDHIPIQNYVTQFSLDVGRFNEVKPWINTIREFIFPFFALLGGSGVLLADKSGNSVFDTFIQILKYLMTILPENASLNLNISFNVSLILVYITFTYLLIRNLVCYKYETSPTRAQIYIWILTSRIVGPIFSMYTSYYFLSNMTYMIAKYHRDYLINFIISIPLFVIQLVYIFFSCSVYNATPIIRNNDSTQFWYSQSALDSEINLVLFVDMIIACILRFLSSPTKEIAFILIIHLLAVLFAFNFWFTIPAIALKYNAVLLSTAFSAVPFSYFPLVAHYASKYSPYYFLACMLFIPGAYQLAKFLISSRCKMIVNAFNNMRATEEQEDNDSNLDPLSAAILHLNKTTNVDFLKMGISGEHTLALYLRIGFLFDVPEVEDQSFIKWCTDQTLKSDLLLSACQVSYALQNDVRMLNSLSTSVQKLSSGPFNTRSFAMLFDHLRQELLTQLNQPLLNSVAFCKRASYSLQGFCSEFWGAAIKQRIHGMMEVLPQISCEQVRTDTLFTNLMRNYPHSQTVFRESVIIYHKSLGDHVKTMDLQAKLNRIRKVGDMDSEHTSSTDLDDVDHNFQDQMDPWISVQQIVENLPFPSRNLLITAGVIMVFLMIFMPLCQLIIALVRVNNFLSTTEPIEIVGAIQMEISRIPQLVRRISLYQQDKIRDVYVGPVRGALLEFNNLSNTRKSLDQYVDELNNNLTSFLDSCTKGNIPDDICSSKNYKIITGDSASDATLYSLISSFLLSAGQLKNLDNMTDINNNENFEFLFDNFNSAIQGITSTLSTLNSRILSYNDIFTRLCYIFYFFTFAVPIFIIVPLIIVSLIIANHEIKFYLRLFFSLPKSEISAIRFSNKKSGELAKQNSNPDDSNEGANLRKEELIENLATVPRYRQGIFMEWIEVCLIFLVGTCILSCVGIYSFMDSLSDLIKMTNSFSYSISVYSNAASCYVWAQELFSNNTDSFTRNRLINMTLTYVDNFHNRFNTLLYGASNNNIEPGLNLGSDIGQVYTRSSFIDTRVVDNDIPIYGVIHDVYYSLSCEAQVSLFSSISDWIFNNTADPDISYADNFTYHYEHILFAHIIPFLKQGMDMFDNKVQDLNTTKTNELMIVYILLLAMQILYALVFVTPSLTLLIHHVKTPRTLICLIPPEALMRSPTIVKWFAGSLSLSSRALIENRSAMNNEAVEFACDYSNCGVALLDEFLQVQSANRRFREITKLSDQNEPIRNLLMRTLVDKDKAGSIQRMERNAKKMIAGVAKTSSVSFESFIASEKGEMQSVLITLYGCSENDESNTRAITTAQSFAIVIQDNNQLHVLEEAIKLEKEKVESLLTLIMPPTVRSKHDDGQDPSLQVDIGSIICATIRSDEPNEELIKTSQLIFQSLDSALNDETIRIRTCGLSYIAIAGLFNHSKSTAQSACDVALKMLSLCSKVVDPNKVTLAIGIHTGSFKCGMVGTLQPVYDVLGDTPQGAMKLSEVCPPWLVHISERTYGEVKFLKYYVKELGAEENGHTYLLSNTSFSLPDSQKNSM